MTTIVPKLAGLLGLAIAFSGCTTRPEPVSADAAARIRQRCPEGTFIGAMTTGCPRFAP